MKAGRLTIEQGMAPRAKPTLPIAARRHPCIARLRRNLRARCGVCRGARLVLGVSGGADSLAMAIGSAVLARRGEIEPRIVHIHHHLRAREADDDARHVAHFCARLSLPFRQLDVHLGRSTENLSDAARRARYRALGEAARDDDARFVAVAHHADDQFETILMSLCRGSEVGLAAMRWSRSLEDDDPSVFLVRPLLDFTRAECKEVCRAAKIDWREDSSNVNPDRARARVRAEVIPVLDALWPGAAARGVASIRSLAEAREVVDHLLAAHFGPGEKRSWSRPDLSVLPASILAAGIRRGALDALGQRASDTLPRRRIEEIAAAIRDDVRRPRRYELGGGFACVVRAREVTLVEEARP